MCHVKGKPSKLTNPQSKGMTSEPPVGRLEALFSAPCVFLGTTLVFTAAASACLTLSLLTDYWEVVTIDPRRAEALAELRNQSLRAFSISVYQVETTTATLFFLVPLHGGVDSLCVDISDDDRDKLRRNGYPLPRCVSYLTLGDTDPKNAWVSRMRNLAISCGLVSLILLGACGLVGIFGLVKRQISAIMVTGVMFVLAALFCVFTLCFMYFKRLRPGGLATGTVMDRGLPVEFFSSRVFSSGWSVALGWGGVGLCVLTGALWILLAKVTRYQILSVT